MQEVFNENRIMQLAEQYHDQYVSADPFPYISIDNFLNEGPLLQAVKDFPSPKELAFYKYENPLEKKLAMDQLAQLPNSIVQILQALNSSSFLFFLEKLSGIEGLIPDPYYRGGGVHQIEPGGKLDVHIDFNIHPKLKLQRRLNVLVYLNQDWNPDWGGNFEIWKGYQKDGKHQLEACMDKILPVFNRFAMFSTSEKSYHGHPEPLACPEGQTRKSIALYYYTVDRPADELTAAHSTTFVKRPEDPVDDDIDKMRDQRNQGRFHSNIKTGIRSK